jgi:hypothetical protein
MTASKSATWHLSPTDSFYSEESSVPCGICLELIPHTQVENSYFGQVVRDADEQWLDDDNMPVPPVPLQCGISTVTTASPSTSPSKFAPATSCRSDARDEMKSTMNFPQPLQEEWSSAGISLRWSTFSSMLRRRSFSSTSAFSRSN